MIIGENTQIGDRAVIHTTKSVEGHVAAATVIGDNVIVGPGAALQSCVIESGASIGANAVVMEAALVEKSARVAEGAVVHPGRRIPAGQLWAGNPAVFVRDLTKGELAEIDGHADEAADNAAHHAREFMPHSEAYLAAEKLGIEDSVRRGCCLRALCSRAPRIPSQSGSDGAEALHLAYLRKRRVRT